MKVFETINDTKRYLKQAKEQRKSIGFVPTMGALHQGHLSLVDYACKDNDLVAVSVFVNPIQFNNKQDLEKYPRDIVGDTKKLEKAGVDMIFMPPEQEMYPEHETTQYDFGQLDKVMEGRFRPGHFNGVAIVVRKLFEIIEPDRAYFGQKDFQQLAIIKELVRKEQMNVEIVPCPIVREDDGLAMSSRNARLTREQREVAPDIYKALLETRHYAGKKPINELKKEMTGKLNITSHMEVEYFEIVDANTLQPIHDWTESENIVACAAVFVGEVRLIDNMMLF
ncbi:MAG: pantoate--beta-alanine ligase [Bacteroidales bacterium]|nr:pantoate--beta-alanine ligase [Bacteroidales bacterium]